MTTYKDMASISFDNGDTVYNVKDATARDAILEMPTIQEIVTLINGTINLVTDKAIYSSTPSGSTTYTFTLPSGTVTGTQAFTFELYIDMSSTAYSLTFPNTLTWQNGETPDLSATGTYFLVFRTIDGGTTWLGNLEGVW